MEGIRDSYLEQKKLDGKLIEEGWDVVSPVNAHRAELPVPGKGHGCQGRIARRSGFFTFDRGVGDMIREEESRLD